MTTFKLSYFNIRGLAEISRVLFAIGGQKYEDYRFPFNTANFAHAEFDAVKSTFTFGTLPVLEVDGHVIAQSKAINRFLAKRFGLYSNDEFEAAAIDSIIYQVEDVRQKWFEARNKGANDGEKKVSLETFFSKTLPSLAGLFENFLTKTGTGHFVGSKLTLADI